MALSLTLLPARERPRERLLARGVEALSDRELLALILGKGRRGESSLDLAARLLADFGGLAEIARARPEELSRLNGIGTAKAAALVAAFRLGRLATDSGPTGPVLRSAADAATVAMRELGQAQRERVIVLVCDSRNRLLRVVRVAEGALDRTHFPVREILNAVLRHDGRAFAIAHNHPSGDPTPSGDDLRATKEITAAAKTVRLRFLDHLVVGAGRWEAVRGLQRTHG